MSERSSLAPVVPRSWYVKALKRISKLERRLREIAPEDPIVQPDQAWGDNVNTKWRRPSDDEK